MALGEWGPVSGSKNRYEIDILTPKYRQYRHCNEQTNQHQQTLVITTPPCSRCCYNLCYQKRRCKIKYESPMDPEGDHATVVNSWISLAVTTTVRAPPLYQSLHVNYSHPARRQSAGRLLYCAYVFLCRR